MHYTSIACITIDFVMKIDKTESSTSLLRRMQIQGKKTHMSRFINTELKSDSESSDLELDSEKQSKFDNELMVKLESGPDSE